MYLLANEMKVDESFKVLPAKTLASSFLPFFLGGSAVPLKPKLQWQCGRVGVRTDNTKVKRFLLQSRFNLGRSGKTQSFRGISVRLRRDEWRKCDGNV